MMQGALIPRLNAARRAPQHAERREFPAVSHQLFNGHIHQIRHRFAAVTAWRMVVTTRCRAVPSHG